MPSAKLPAAELRRRIENHLQKLGCGLRQIQDGFAIYDVKDGGIIMISPTSATEPRRMK